MWKVIAIVEFIMWIGTAISATLVTHWIIQNELEKRDQGRKVEYTYYLVRTTIIDYKVPGHPTMEKEDIIGVYPDKDTAIAAMEKTVEFEREALKGLTGHEPYGFDYPKWNRKELYLDNNQFKEKQYYDIKAF